MGDESTAWQRLSLADHGALIAEGDAGAVVTWCGLAWTTVSLMLGHYDPASKSTIATGRKAATLGSVSEVHVTSALGHVVAAAVGGRMLNVVVAHPHSVSSVSTTRRKRQLLDMRRPIAHIE